MPQILENNTNVRRIIIFSFIFLFCLNNINRPKPDPDSNPAIQLPKGIICSKYNSVITILDTQLGINPRILDNIGLIILLSLINVISVSESITKFNIMFIIKINENIFNV